MKPAALRAVQVMCAGAGVALAALITHLKVGFSGYSKRVPPLRCHTAPCKPACWPLRMPGMCSRSRLNMTSTNSDDNN
jgi:hypothetical protein